MKKLIYLLLLSGIFLFSACKGDSTKDKSKESNEAIEIEKTAEEAVEETKDEKKALTGNECDDYLASYEAWVEDYLKFLKEIKDNPGNMAIAAKHVEWTEEATKWAENYSKLVNCAMDPEFQQKYMKIVERLTAAANEMYEEEQ